MENRAEQITDTTSSGKPTIRNTLESLYAILWDIDLCYSMRDFSVYWLGKSPRYFSTLQSENGNGSFEVLLYAKEMIRSAIEDFDESDYQSDHFIKLERVKHSLEDTIKEMMRNLIVE